MASIHVKPLSPPDDWDAFWEQYIATRTPLELSCIARQEAVLASYAKVGTLKASCEAIDRTYEMADMWVKRDVHHFNRRLAWAREQYAASLETLMHERLHDPKGNRGSDILLMFDLKAKRPDVYRELPIVIGGDANRELQAKLVAMMAKQLGAAKQESPKETIEGQVIKALGPGLT